MATPYNTYRYYGGGAGPLGDGWVPLFDFTPPPPPEEVWISADEPTDPAIELWFDTDEIVPTARQVVEPKSTITSYTLGLADENKVLWFTSASAITLTIPTFASVPIPDGWRVDVLQTGGGRITVAGAGITIIGTPTLVLRATG